MNKLLKQIVLYLNLFLLIVMLLVIAYYEFFAEKFLIETKKKNMNLAFECIAQKDLNEVGEEEEGVMVSSAEDNYTIVICNDKYELIYSQKTVNVQKTILNKIIKKKDQFMEKPVAIYSPEKRN